MAKLKVWKTFSVVMVLVLIAALGAALVPASPVEAQATWYVDGALGTDDGTHGTGPGVNAFKTIQYAINDSRVTGGDTINVAAGTYDEQVVINKSLTLQGAGNTTIVKPSSADKLTTVLDGNHYGGTVKIAGIIVANVPSGASVTVKNLKVDGSGVTTMPTGAKYFAGIFYGETGGIVDTVSVVGGGAWSPDQGFGAYLSAVTNTVSVEVKGSTITNYDKSGIDAYGNKLTVDIHHNTVTGRGPISDECQNGIILDTTTGTVNSNIVSNNVWGPGPTWTATGIAFVDADGSATGNTLTDNQLGAGAQGLDPGSWTVSFINNTVNAAGLATAVAGLNAATYYTDEAFVTVAMDGNQLTGGPCNGIYIGDSVPENLPYVAGSVMATISNNLISDWQHGINLASSVASGSTITGNTIINNAMSGLYIGAAVNATNVNVHFNNIVGNTVYGASNAGAGTLDATYNWWGSSSGPYHATLNPGGTGDAVSDYVDFEPWLLEVPTVTTQAATEVSLIHATLNMNYTVGGYSPVQVRFAYKESAETEWSYTGWVSKTADGTHAEGFVGLPFGTQYDFKAQLKYDDIVYGDTVLEGATLQFTTAAITPSACFIATAAYGTPTAEQINVLREFRDVVLLKSTVGSQFVALYYQLSPPVADFIAGNEILRTLVREFLVDPIVRVVKATGDIWRN